MHLGLIIFQFGIYLYLYAKSESSRMKNERVMTILEGMAKILFKWGRANRVKIGFHQGGVHLGLIIFQFGIYLYAKSGSSRMKNE